ncbi:unnamed protein product [Rotaria sordida]|uniref:Uncharacterized protein n=1 Tax=Rotaria sordida TaxID=392033 RepID=A0A814BSN5_9BILA|nr:unnamed protein product [Rotaria sordida]
MYILGESILCRTTTTTLPDATSLAYINSRCASSDTYWDLNYLTDLTFIESGILPNRVICLLFSNNMGQQNIDIYQCTLPSQYRIGRTFILLICYKIIIICCNIICLIQSIRSFVSRSKRQKVWHPYCHAQSVIPLDNVQARYFVEYIGCDGHYIFTVLQKHMNRITFQRFFELFVELTFTETHL